MSVFKLPSSPVVAAGVVTALLLAGPVAAQPGSGMMMGPGMGSGMIAAACPREVPQTATARLEAMEKRLEAMLAAVKTVRPAFDAFYVSLTSEQKTALDRVGPRHWRWPGWRWGQGER
jgi:hypothetical protein